MVYIENENFHIDYNNLNGTIDKLLLYSVNGTQKSFLLKVRDCKKSPLRIF